MREEQRVVQKADFAKMLMPSVCSQVISAETKIIVMHQVTAKWPKVCSSCHGIQMPLSLYSCSEVMLLQQLYQKYLMFPVKRLMTEKVEAHTVHTCYCKWWISTTWGPYKKINVQKERKLASIWSWPSSLKRKHVKHWYPIGHWF